MASAPLFIASTSRVAARLARLRLHAKGDWETTYIDPVSREQWIAYPLWDYHGPGPTGLRRGSPLPEEVIARIAETEFADEAAAAAYYLAHEVPQGYEHFESLVERLELKSRTLGSVVDQRNIALAIAWSGIEKAFNHRSTIGKQAAEVEEDAQYFAGLAERVRVLASRAERLVGRATTNDPAVFRDG